MSTSTAAASRASCHTAACFAGEENPEQSGSPPGRQSRGGALPTVMVTRARLAGAGAGAGRQRAHVPGTRAPLCAAGMRWAAG